MAKPRSKKPITDAVDILHCRYFEGQPEMLALLEQARVNAEVAQKVYDLRTAAGLTQRELAEKVGTKPSVICRLEDADYTGHSLTMLQRIAAALGRKVEVNFVPAQLSAPQAAEEGGRANPASKRPAKTHGGAKSVGRNPLGSGKRGATGRGNGPK